MSVRWVARHDDLGDPDLVVIPGTRSTIDDLSWLRATGLAAALDALRTASSPPPVILGICGGFQMMGEHIDDPDAVESSATSASGSGLVAGAHHVRRGQAHPPHRRHGVRHRGPEPRRLRDPPRPAPTRALYTPWFDGDAASQADDDVISAVARPETSAAPRCTASSKTTRSARGSWPTWLPAGDRPWEPSGLDYAAARQAQIDRVADACEEHLDLERIWRIVETGRAQPSRRARMNSTALPCISRAW